MQAGVFLSGANGYSVGDQTDPTNLAIDGDGNAWVSTSAGGFVAELSPAGTVLFGNGLTASNASNVGTYPFGIAVDASVTFGSRSSLVRT